MAETTETINEEIQELIRTKIENLRPKLLDLSRRNPLISTKFSTRSNSHFRIVDELPDSLAFFLSNQKRMRFVPLPLLEEDPADEQTRQFQSALTNARLTDDAYLADLDSIDPYSDTALERNRLIERKLKDQIREQFSMSPHLTSGDVSLPQHARNNGISPSYDLPDPDDEDKDGRHADADIQTLLLPKDLERKLNALMTKCRTWEQETGINVLHAAYGFLEWAEPNGQASSFAPLVLGSMAIEKKKTRTGVEFWVQGNGDIGETNSVLAEMLWFSFKIEIPKYEGGSIEEYLKVIADLQPPSIRWKVRRQVAFGVFPSARMAMYHDLDTAKNTFAENRVISSLLGGTSMGGTASVAEDYDVDQPEVEIKVPILVCDADSSQFSTLVDVADGKNIAVEGPPGTGKSQTIVNAIAAALAEGKKVLFIAEKLAALDVVKSRLEAVGLGDFILPLQATRSSRVQVINSIRERVEMDVARTSIDYEAKIERYKKTRAELASYVQAISAKFGRTEFTVYDILGKSIATNDVLLSMPKALLAPNIDDVEGFGKAEINTCKELGIAVEKAWQATELVEPYWREHKILNLDRFSVENICELAGGAADSFKDSSDARTDLTDFGIDQNSNVDNLNLIDSSLGALQIILNTVDVPLVGRICREGTIEVLKTFLGNCQKFNEDELSLSGIFEDTADENLSELVKLIQNLCATYSLGSLNIEKLKLEKQEDLSRLTRYENLLNELNSFVEVLPESADYSIVKLQEAYQLVAATPRKVLALRNQITADPTAIDVINLAKTTGIDLLSRKKRIENFISLTQATSNSELASLRYTLREAGLFRIISPAYRSAKQSYLSISRRLSFEKEIAANDILSIISWNKEEKVFSSDQQFSVVFGLHFKGVETNFDIFTDLMDYYSAVDIKFTGASNQGIRAFLKSGELDLLQSIPELGNNVEDETFTELFAKTERLKCNLQRYNLALEKLSTLITRLKSPSNIDVKSLDQILILAESHRDRKAMILSDGKAKDLLGEHFNAASKDPKVFSDNILAAETILSHQLGLSVVLLLLESKSVDTARSAIQRVLQKVKVAENELMSISQLTQIDIDCFVTDRTDSQVSDYLRLASKDTDGLYIFSRYAVARLDLHVKSFDWVTKCLLQENLPLTNLGEIIEAVIVRAQAISVYKQFGPVLSRYSGDDLNQRRSLLAKLDKEIIKESGIQLRNKVRRAANPPAGNGVGRKSTWTEMSLIENELGKQKRFISTRELTNRAGKALLELKPCWMMSPLAVAQYLPRETLKFDLCIIDEASQMPPEDSIGALARCQQAMVVGDTNQLPPMSFFRKMLDDDDADEDEKVLDESILEVANAAFRPRRRLRWHYRSRHPSLIKFSSHMVYNDSLVVFPSAFESKPDMGVSLVLVQGNYKSGTNSRSGTNTEEATAIIDATLAFMRSSPDRSLGIVTLNQKQRDLLLEEMEYAVSHDSTATKYIERWVDKNDGLEPFFIKNLENVQGDERDVIFIGTVYGPEQPGGPVMQRFGPINGLAGKRRLNVLFSRAKQQIITFSSMTAADIRADEHTNLGAHMLKCWLEYSATGILHTGETTNLEPDSDFEEFVIEQIQAIGCEPVPQIGVKGYRIDIGVKHPEWPHGFIMAVECDGATYHSSKSARDRDRLRQEVLEGLGWHFYRIWSTDWFNDHRKETERLREAITKRLQELKEKANFSEPVFETPVTAEYDIQPSLIIETESNPQEEITFEPQAPRVDSTDQDYISVGDTVRIRYLTGSQSIIKVTLSATHNAPDQGIVHISEPIGSAVLGMEEGDEIEVLIGSYLREAIIEEVTKAADGGA